MDAEYMIIGGGVVGLSVAWGLQQLKKTVLVFDGTDKDFRASQGNFGLIWTQGKGLSFPEYAKWTLTSAQTWKSFADQLSDQTGHDVEFKQNGGYDFYMDEEKLAKRVQQYEYIKGCLGGDYPYEMLRPAALRAEEPHIGPKVAGALLHQKDGHVNPLKLLTALNVAVQKKGSIFRRSTIANISQISDGFRAVSKDGREYQARKVVICAGLGALTIAPQLGFKAPVRPQRGQVIITEKLPRILQRPASTIRQVDEGGIQLGDSQEEVGFNKCTKPQVLADIARRAISIIPRLAKVNAVRCWGALRVMTPDGLPIYQQSTQCPGAFLITCHSGITLAASHGFLIPKWLEGDDSAPQLESFSETRF